MSTKKPRINVVFDDAVYKNLKQMAEKENVSLSAEVQFLVKEAMEVYEDAGLAKIADDREKKLKGKKLLSHKQAWK